jgi:hypothetical protein
MKIALKPCRHCAFTKHHLGTKEEVTAAIALLESEGKTLCCHEYSEPTMCASHCAKKGIKGTRQISKGDLYSRYANMSRAIMNTCGLGGIKLLVEVS